MELSKAAIVVAHPDDEVIWFSSLTRKVAKIVMCYGSNPRVVERENQRRKVVQDYPIKTVQFLDLPEPDFWRGRQLGPVDQELARLDNENPEFRERLAADLRSALKNISTVFVHNPWGEYGHDDHRRLYLVVSELQKDMGFQVYVSNYVEKRALHLMNAVFNMDITDIAMFEVEADDIMQIVRLYKQNSCWTWAENWKWPKQEQFLRVEGTKKRAAAVPLMLFNI